MLLASYKQNDDVSMQLVTKKKRCILIILNYSNGKKRLHYELRTKKDQKTKVISRYYQVK